MKKMLCVLLLASSGCYYEGYAVRRVAPSEPPVAKDEVERLTGAGVSEPVIVEMVEKRGAAPLSADDLVALKKAGVGDALVQKMIANEHKEPAVVLEDYYAYYPPSYYYGGYYPYYPYYGGAYFGVGVGVGYGWGYHHHHSHPRGSGGVRVYR